jgi:Mg-chelatase subunit ChlD
MIGMLSERTRRLRKLLASLSAFLVLSQCLGASYAWACHENAMIVFDASGSMTRRHNGRSKIDIARKAVAEVLPSVTEHRPTGLITYGGREKPLCHDIVVRVEPELGSAKRIVAALEGLQPLGPTALTASVGSAVEILRRRNAPGIIVLITDGLENCGGRTCEFARRLRERGDEIRVHVIGFLLQGVQVDTLKCLTEATSGTYVAADSLESLRNALRTFLDCLRISRSRSILEVNSIASPNGIRASHAQHYLPNRK